MTAAVGVPTPWWNRPALFAVVVCLLISLLVVLQVVRDARYQGARIEAQTLYLPSGPVLGRLALSFDALLADVYWMRAVNHYGSTKMSEDEDKSYDLLYPLLDITTSLDPRFNVAYRFGSIFLTEAFPDGPGRPDLAVALLQKGIRSNPSKWEYFMDVGFIYYWWLQDYEEAAVWFERASQVPGASWWLTSLAANTQALGGNRASARLLWSQMYETADNEWMQNEALRGLAQIDALDQIDLLSRVVEEYQRNTGRLPAAWEDLVAAGALRAVPLDPAGFQYLLAQRTGEVLVSPQSPLFPLPDVPPGPMPQ